MQDPTPAANTPAPQPNAEISHEVHRTDGMVRMVLWGLLIFNGVNQLSGYGTVSVREYFVPFTVFSLLMAGYVLVSVQSVAQAVREFADKQPVLLGLLPVLLVVPYALYARDLPDFDPATLLASAMMLFLPASCAMLNTPQLKGGDVAIGLITVALPLVGPLLRNEALERSDALLRLCALALPVLLLLLTNRDQKQRLNFLFICAVLSLWFSIEFSAFPEYILPNSEDLNYFSLAVLPAFLYVLALSGRFGQLGLSFKPSARGLGLVLLHFLGLGVIMVSIGLTSGLLSFNWSAPEPLPALSKAFTLYLFISLPEELLFRGALLTNLKETLAWPDWSVVGLSSLIFGLSHLNNPPENGATVWWVVLLATISGVAYARVFLLSKNVAAPAALHAAVNWVWDVAFR
jgi:membrane protease YdiL (CAAX protease family)